MTSPISNISTATIQSPVVHSSRYWTDVKIKRVALIALAVLSAVSAVALACLAISGVVTVPLAALCPIFLGISVSSGIYVSTLKDYENLKELSEMKEAAKNMSFLQLYKKHGIKNLRRYFKDLFPLPELSRRFHEEIRTMHFSDVCKSFHLEDLIQITPPEHIALLHSLDKEAACLDRVFDSQVALARKRHFYGTDAYLYRLDDLDHPRFYNRSHYQDVDYGYCMRERIALDQEIEKARQEWLFERHELANRYAQYKTALK